MKPNNMQTQALLTVTDAVDSDDGNAENICQVAALPLRNLIVM
jgi:hypothetical protein